MHEIRFKPALMISSDGGIFNPTSDAAKRMEEYAKLYESVHVLVVARGVPEETKEVLPHVFAYPVSYTIKPLGLLKLFKFGRRLAKELEFSAVYAQDPFWFGLVALRLSRRFGIPFAVGVYGMDINNLFFAKEALAQRIAMRIEPFVSRRADAIQTDGPETIDYLKKHYGEKIFFKPMFPANRDELKRLIRNVPEKQFKLLFVGRFAAQKNLPLLIDVIADTVEKLGDAISFTMVGGGNLKDAFFKKIRKRGLEKNVFDAGVLDRAEIIHAYASHHALILTSFDEGFPRVFMEAALAGMPIITSDVGGVKDLVIDGVTGRVFPQGTTASVWAEAIASLAKAPETLASMSRALTNQFETMYGNKSVLDYQRPLAEFLESKRSNYHGH